MATFPSDAVAATFTPAPVSGSVGNSNYSDLGANFESVAISYPPPDPGHLLHHRGIRGIPPQILPGDHPGLGDSSLEWLN